MPSIRNNGSEDRYLDAARECILATGWTRTTLTDVARRAGVSRMTIYRTWPDMQTLLADLMTREWGGVVAAVASAGAGLPPAERLSLGVSRTVAALRSNDLLRKIVEVDPELLLTYLLALVVMDGLTFAPRKDERHFWPTALAFSRAFPAVWSGCQWVFRIRSSRPQPVAASAASTSSNSD